MRVHSLVHIGYEGIGAIEEWIEMHGHKHTSTNLFLGEQLPEIDSFDMLLIMGGPMSVNDNLSFIADEKKLILKSIEKDKFIIGICLGAQMISSALGGTVTKNKYKEIGWFPVKKSQWLTHPLANYLPFHFTTFHWHVDTFSIPAGALNIMESEACPNQAFIYGDKTIGLQFHPEFTPDQLLSMTEKGKSELVKSEFVQTADEIIKNIHLCGENNIYLFRILDYFAYLSNKGQQL